MTSSDNQDNQAAERKISFYLHGKNILVADVSRGRCERTKALLFETGAASVECVWDHRKASAAIQNPKFAMILADWNFVMQTGEDYDNDDSPKRQKSRSVSRANSLRGLNFLKSIQSMPVETPIVFMHFDAEVDEVKRTLVTTRTPDQKRRNYIITKPLQMNNLESLIGRNEVITKVFLELTDITDDYYKELQSVHNRFDSPLQKHIKTPTKIKLRGIENASKVMRLGSQSIAERMDNFKSVKQTVKQAFHEGGVLSMVPAGQRVPYWQQGNLEHYTDEKLNQRLKLKEQSGIVHAIRMFWNAQDLVKDHRGCIHKSAYLVLNVKLQKALDQDFQLGTALATAKTDWKRDGGRRRMSYAQFFESMFEMTDLWCKTVSERDYVTFLLSLLETVATGCAKTLKVSWKEDK